MFPQVAEFISKLFDTEGFPPRWFCGHWTEFHGWLYVVSDLAIWGAYISIPLILLYFTRRIKDLPFTPVFWLFAAFILVCGTTHMLDAAMFWWPAYRFTAVVEMLTAIISWATVFALIPVIPQALAFKSPKQLERLIDQRTAELQISEERFRRAMDFSPIGMMLLGSDGSVFRVNNALCQLSGYSQKEWLEKENEFLTHPEDNTNDKNQYNALLSNSIEGYQLDKRWLHKNGSTVWVKIHVSMLEDTQKNGFLIIKQVQDITEHKRLEEERRQFLSALTHDLRAPLTAEKVALGALRKQNENLSQSHHDLFDSLSKNNADLLNLVNQLIEMFQYEHGKVVLIPASVDVEALLEETIVSMRPLMDLKHIHISKQVASQARWVMGDYYQLKRVFTNLLGNAYASLSDGGVVHITAQLVSDNVQIEVRDNGPGIPNELLRHLFEPYYSSRRKIDKVGSGLGLSIAKHILELHEGSISVASESGRGTTFILTLPSVQMESFNTALNTQPV